MKRIELNVKDMMCQNCVKHVTHALEGQPAVKEVTVDLDAGKATVMAEAEVSIDGLINAVNEEGYPTELESVTTV